MASEDVTLIVEQTVAMADYSAALASALIAASVAGLAWVIQRNHEQTPRLRLRFRALAYLALGLFGLSIGFHFLAKMQLVGMLPDIIDLSGTGGELKQKLDANGFREYGYFVLGELASLLFGFLALIAFSLRNIRKFRDYW